MQRHDYAFPFRIDGASRQAQQSPYAAHVAQMVRQVLLTDLRGARGSAGIWLRPAAVDLRPQLGCPARSTKVLVMQG